MNFILKKSDLVTKIIAWIQIAGGIMGLGVIAYLMLNTGTINGALLLIFIVGLSLFIFSIYCGNILLQRNEVRRGIILSLVNQALQFVQWSMFGWGLSYNSGLNLAIGLKGTSIDARLNIIASNFQMSINSDDTFLFKVNILAVWLFIILLKIYHKPMEQEIDPEIIPYEDPVFQTHNEQLL
jgi:hypothetical protein